MHDRFRSMTMTVPWNIFLLTVGGIVFAFGLKAIAMPHEFVSGGISGVAMLIVYAADFLTISFWYALLNVPILFMGWKFLSRRFMLYTLYNTVVTSIAVQIIPWDAGIHDRLLAAVAAGICCGAGSGIALRSLGSGGGLDVVSLILNSRFNINVGSVGVIFNAMLYALALPIISVDNVLYSMVVAFFSASIMNYFAGLFNERKLAIIISEKHEEIAGAILKHLGRGCTLLHGQGAFTKKEKEVLLVVVHNIQAKRLEELVFNVDPASFVILENTQLVLGKGFSKRKIY